MKINVYPKNKKHFVELLDFYRQIRIVCNELNIEPVIWGSVSYFGYTKETTYTIHDIDLIIPLKDILKLKKYFEENNYKINFIEGWNSLQVFNGHLLIEFDPIEDYSDKLSFQEINFYGTKMKSVSIDVLIKQYKKASEVSEDKPKEHRRKYDNLLKVKLK